MLSFIKKAFGKDLNPASKEANGLVASVQSQSYQYGRGGKPTEFDWSQTRYVPLPPSPPTWEVDRRHELYRDYEDPFIGPVLRAGSKKQHTKVVKLAASLPLEHLRGPAGEVVAKAYVKLITQRIKSGQLMAAAKQSVELLERLPEYVKDADLRRFNRILKDLDKLGKKHNYLPIPVESSSSLELFQTSEDAPWGLVSQRKLIKEERPDPAFTVISIDARGTWLLDRQGASIDLPGVKSVLRRVDREGALVSEKALNHDAYRTGISGCALAILDSGGVLRIYDEKLNALVESNLGEDSRVIEHFRSTDTNYWGELKSQVRAVDAASEGDRYLFTLADEVWCCTASGKTIWGLVMPLKEGWKRVVERSHRSGLAQDVEDSLELLGLSLPVAPVDIKKQYRKLVLAHHPDRNSGDPAATEKMKDLNAAFEILTGVDPNSLDYEESGVTHFTKTAPDYVLELEGARLEICITGEVPQDWVYAASFAGVDGGAYLATYSGKIARVSPEGQPEVVYDIGVCPKEIVEVGQYTYFLTATRLYVIEKTDTLVACVDVFQQGRLLVTQTGFGLLAAKQLRWFTHTGTRVGELTTKDPIRAIYATDDGTVFQTRQHQVEVQGLIM